MSHGQPLVTIGLSIVLLAACGAAKAAGEAFAHDAGAAGKVLAHDADHLPNGDLHLPTGPDVHVPTNVGVEDAVQERVQQTLDAHADGLDSAEVFDLVEDACQAKKLIDIGEASTWDEAAERAFDAYGGDAAVHARVQGLAEELSADENSTDGVTILAAEAMCEVAERNG